jgi:hypothetical protein
MNRTKIPTPSIPDIVPPCASPGKDPENRDGPAPAPAPPRAGPTKQGITNAHPTDGVVIMGLLLL